MAKLNFVPAPVGDKEASIAFMEAYRKQNPVKYEQKKAAMMKMFGLDEVPEPVKDASEVELEVIKEKVKKK
jgi:hypothetical protein